MNASNFKSDYVLDIRSNRKNDIYSSYIDSTVKEFLAKFNITNFIYIEPRNQISYLDFKNKNIKFDYFYEYIMSDVIKHENTIEVKRKVCVTFDKRICDNLNVDSGRYYSTLSVGGYDLVYFILFTLDEIYDYIYDNN